MHARRLYTLLFCLIPALAAAVILSGGPSSRPLSANAPDIVLYASDAATVRGHWSAASTTSGAGGQMMRSSDGGWSSASTALASPANYFELTFTAPAGTPYRIWLRLRATGNSKWNDSVWVQFSNALVNGAAAYRIGSSSGLGVNLERCGGCGVASWGWANGSYWLDQATTVSFAASGTQTIRIQTREDGVEIDQVLLSPATYLSSRPGAETNDTTILPRTSTAPAPPASTPYSGTPHTVPGTIDAALFDNGGAGVAYFDSSSGNAGGVFRSTDVDLEGSSLGGYNIGWTAPGEWVAYTVNVATAGAYTVQARVASISASSVQVAFDAPSNAAQTISVPNTGGWQQWTTVSVPITLAAGRQVMTVRFPAGGINLRSVSLAEAAPASPPVPGGSTPYTGTPHAVPGTIDAALFDHGGAGIAYSDTTSGNAGRAFRSTDVDIEGASVGGYNIGWTEAGEWLAYTVNVATTGAYTLQVRVATVGASSVQVNLGAPSHTAQTLNIPNTGGWQQWTTMSVPITLTAGRQVLVVRFPTGGVNLRSLSLATSSTVLPPSSGGQTLVVDAGGDLQAALDVAQPGDTILLQAGATFTGNFVLPAKSGDAFITLRSSAADSTLPPSGVRMTPAYAGQLPKLRSPNTAPAIATAPGAHHYRLQFLEFRGNGLGAGNILELGDGSARQNSLAVVPHNLIVDRVYLHGDPVKGQIRGIALNSASTKILNSYISDIKLVNADTQAIAGWNGPGPYEITNNYLEGAGENILFGGGDPRIPNLVPSDITIRRNHIAKPLAWRTENWTVKNLIELKNAQRVVIEGNVIENIWASGQAGYAIMLTSVNQEGTAPWSVVQQVTIANNIIRNAAAGINVSRVGGMNAIEVNRVTVRNNLFDNISKATYGGSGWFMLVMGGSDIVVDHNTIINDGTSALFADSYQSSRFVFTNNLLIDRMWAIMGANASPGNGTITKFFPYSQFFGGIYVGSRPADYPTGNFYPPTIGDVGFVDFSGRNYRLGPNSIYRGGGTDGKDPGADFDALAAAQP
jgi:hypothetical protein